MAHLPQYNAGRFSDIASKALGKNLWEFLNDPATVQAMIVASDLFQPAVAGIEESLLNKFGDAVLNERVKQMIGHMVKQVMESKGYIVDKNDVKIGSVPFAKGTRYRHPDWHPIHVFRSTMNPRDLCFTDTRARERLPPPPAGAQWRYWSTFSTVTRGIVGFGVSPKEALREIQKRGFLKRRLNRILRAPA